MPDVLKAAIDCEKFGAQGITVHPRPDGRHIRYDDVTSLKPILSTEFNIEGNPIESFIDLVLKVHPAQVTLVPDKADALTSNAGWDTRDNLDFLKNICKTFNDEGIRTSIFVDPDVEMIKYAAQTGCRRVELYTEAYAREYPDNPEKSIEPYFNAAQEAVRCGLELNAGHDLSLVNLNYFCKIIPNLMEVSIGHALICDALYTGLDATIKAYLKEIQSF